MLLQPVTQTSLPQLAEGVTVAVLRRVWAATPAEAKREAATVLESTVLVLRADGNQHVRLRDLTLAEVERAIGAVTPKYVVRFYEYGKRGTQAQTFVEYADGERFAAGKKLYGEPARVQPILGGGR
jgi:hypothetical protein